MIGLTTILLGAAGLVVAPYLIDLTDEFIQGPNWFPYAIVGVFAFVLWVVNAIRWAAAGVIVGIVAYGALLVWAPEWIDFLPEAPKPF